MDVGEGTQTHTASEKINEEPESGRVKDRYMNTVNGRCGKKTFNVSVKLRASGHTHMLLLTWGGITGCDTCPAQVGQGTLK